MKVPFVNLPKQIFPYHNEIRRVVDEVIFDRADFIMRQDLIEFENQFAQYVGTKYAIGVANGSDALNLALKVLEIGPGDEVITVSHTFIATIAAIVHAGAEPVLVDVGADHNMDITKIGKAVTSRTKAIMPVHLNGRVCIMDEIISLAQKHNLFVIEDSAQAIGAMYKNRKAGSFGHLSTNSFYPFKILGCFGDGGAITTDDADLIYKLRCLRDNGQDRKKGEILFWGWNSRLDNLQAAILCVLLNHVPEMISQRRKIGKLYCDQLRGVGDIFIPHDDFDNINYFDVFQNFVITTKRRDELVKFLDQNGVGTLISWPTPNHFHKGLHLNFHLPNTERISKEVLSLPMHPALTDEEVQYVITVINNFY